LEHSEAPYLLTKNGPLGEYFYATYMLIICCYVY